MNLNNNLEQTEESIKMIKAIYLPDTMYERAPIFTLNGETNKFEFGYMKFDYNMVVNDDEWYVYREELSNTVDEVVTMVG